MIMFMHKGRGGGRKRGVRLLRLFIKLLRILRLSISSKSRCPYLSYVEFENLIQNDMVPEDVKEGHFAVYAAKSEHPKRFVIELHYLKNPAFLRLLEKAGEVYGFHQRGVLAVPCAPEDLEKIVLHDKLQKIASAITHRAHWATCNI